MCWWCIENVEDALSMMGVHGVCLGCTECVEGA